jgi:hypothetical protein
VPGLGDFDRLDPRFVLPAQVWEKKPELASYGFAVFRLRTGEQAVHPMAFSFVSAKPDQLFFPTVHVHDGEMHPEEEFDHILYCQADARPQHWKRGPKMQANDVLTDQRCFRLELRGILPNDDTWAHA